MRDLVVVACLGAAAGCLAPTPTGERAVGQDSAPIDVQATWKTPGEACPDGFVQLGTDDDVLEGFESGRPAVCVHRDFCAARPWSGAFCAGAPKDVLTTDPATFWSDFLVDCPAIGPIVGDPEPGTATISIEDASEPSGVRVYALDASSVHTRMGPSFRYEPCLTNPDGAGLRDPSCGDASGPTCGWDGDAVVECVPTSVDDRRGGGSTRIESVEVVARRPCSSGICESSPGRGVACQEDRALEEPYEWMDDSGNVFLMCSEGRGRVDVRGVPMCLTEAFCAAHAPGLYCDETPAAVTNTRLWGDLDPSDAVTPGALVVAGDVAVRCGRDAAGAATTELFPCASGTCVGNSVGFGCVDTSCEIRNFDTDFDSLYWSGTDEAIAVVEGMYCSDQRPGNILDCQLVQAWDARAQAFAIRLLPQSNRRCAASTPLCAPTDDRSSGSEDACVAATAAE